MYEKTLWQKPPGGLFNAYHLRQWIRKKPWPMRRSWFVTLNRSAVVRKAVARNSTVQCWCLEVPTLDSWQPWWEWDILQWWIWPMHLQHPYDFIPKKSRSMSTMQRWVNQQRGPWKVVQASGVSWVSAEVFVFLKLEEELQKGLMIETVCGSNSKGVE